MTRDLLLQKGLELFGSKGYMATSVEDIASAAGATRTTFYLHFQSKADLMSRLLDRCDAILTAVDDPSLGEIVESGAPDLIRAWLDRKMSQWDEIKPYLTASYQASNEPEVTARTERWYEDVVAEMTEGLERAGRFDPEQRRIRCLLAFGQFEYLSRRYFAVGWRVEREVCLDQVTESWCHLLT